MQTFLFNDRCRLSIGAGSPTVLEATLGSGSLSSLARRASLQQIESITSSLLWSTPSIMQGLTTSTTSAAPFVWRSWPGVSSRSSMRTRTQGALTSHKLGISLAQVHLRTPSIPPFKSTLPGAARMKLRSRMLGRKLALLLLLHQEVEDLHRQPQEPQDQLGRRSARPKPLAKGPTHHSNGCRAWTALRAWRDSRARGSCSKRHA